MTDKGSLEVFSLTPDEIKELTSTCSEEQTGNGSVVRETPLSEVVECDKKLSSCQYSPSIIVGVNKFPNRIDQDQFPNKTDFVQQYITRSVPGKVEEDDHCSLVGSETPSMAIGATFEAGNVPLSVTSSSVVESVKASSVPETPKSIVTQRSQTISEKSRQIIAGLNKPRRSRSKGATTLPSGVTSTSSTMTSRRTRASATMTTTTGTESGSTVFVSVVTGRGISKGEVGFAMIDTTHPTITLAQFCDSQSYVRLLCHLKHLKPAELILPDTLVRSTLYKILEQNDFALVAVQRLFFNESHGLQALKQVCVDELWPTVEVQLERKYYCLSASGALLKYLEHLHNHLFVGGTLRVEYQSIDNTVLVDFSSVKYLELLENARNPRSPFSLFGLLNRTKSPMGMRLLRANILRPPKSKPTVLVRHQTIREMLTTNNLICTIQELLKKFGDVDQLMTRLLCRKETWIEHSPAQVEARITQLLQLKHILQLVEPLQELLANTQSSLMTTISEALLDERFEQMLSVLNEVLNDQAAYEKSAGRRLCNAVFAVRAGINDYLDISRQRYIELFDQLNAHAAELGEQHGLIVRLSYTQNRGYFFSMPYAVEPRTSLPRLPDICQRVVRARNTVNFTTSQLSSLNDKIRCAVADLMLLSQQVLSGVCDALVERIYCLHQLSESLASLDLMASFAEVAAANGYTEPVLDESESEGGSILCARNTLHPILDRVQRGKVVPNDIKMNSDRTFLTLTGPNMAGKTVYLQQVALLQVMAQIGSYVPAESGSRFPLISRLFSRVGSDDDFEKNLSTFQCEMHETAYILNNFAPDALILVDELGRGTSTSAGLALCISIAQYLIQHRYRCVFATHFLEVAQLCRRFSNAVALHLHVDSAPPDDKSTSVSNGSAFSSSSSSAVVPLRFTYLLSEGPTDIESYGTKLCELANIPPFVIGFAKDIRERLEVQVTPLDLGSDEQLMAPFVRGKSLYNLVDVFGPKSLSTPQLKKLKKRHSGNDMKSDDDSIVMAFFRRCQKQRRKFPTLAAARAAEEKPSKIQPAVTLGSSNDGVFDESKTSEKSTILISSDISNKLAFEANATEVQNSYSSSSNIHDRQATQNLPPFVTSTPSTTKPDLNEFKVPLARNVARRSTSNSLAISSLRLPPSSMSSRQNISHFSRRLDLVDGESRRLSGKRLISHQSGAQTQCNMPNTFANLVCPPITWTTPSVRGKHVPTSNEAPANNNSAIASCSLTAARMRQVEHRHENDVNSVSKSTMTTSTSCCNVENVCEELQQDAVAEQTLADQVIEEDEGIDNNCSSTICSELHETNSGPDSTTGYASAETAAKEGHRRKSMEKRASALESSPFLNFTDCAKGETTVGTTQTTSGRLQPSSSDTSSTDPVAEAIRHLVGF